MAERTEREQDERGLSARHLILVFLAGVAVCGVFFSLGFLVGFNERSSRTAPVTERVTPPPAIPPTVNAPLASASPGTQRPATTTTAASARAQSQSTAPAAPSAESKPATTAATSRAPAASPASTRKAEKPAEPAPAPTASPGEVGVGFTVQVVASRTKEDAEKVVAILKGHGYPVFLVAPEYAHAKDNLFRVQVGPFATRDDAEKVRARLSQEGFKPFIRH